jgi:hypothetical protein
MKFSRNQNNSKRLESWGCLKQSDPLPNRSDATELILEDVFWSKERGFKGFQAEIFLETIVHCAPECCSYPT